MAYYCDTIPDDIALLAPKLREIDVKEIEAMTGEDPETGLRESFKVSLECNSIFADDGEIVGMFGVVDAAPDLGVPWLLASPRLPEIAKVFMAGAEDWVKKIQGQFPVLANYVMADNEVAIRWLKRLGFVMMQKIPIGRNGEEFLEFARVKDV